MSILRWAPAPGVRVLGRILLVHGLSSLAQTWWQVGPRLADRGWDVTAVDQPATAVRRRPTR